MSDQKNALENDEHASKQNSHKTKRNKFFRKPSFHFFHTLLSKFKKGKRPASSDLSTSITSSMSTSATENYTDAINKSVSILSLYRKNEGNLPHINRTGVRSIKTISPNGYQAIVTKTNTILTEIDQSYSVKTDLDMKIRLPRNVPPDSVMVSMHMDPITYVASNESFIEPDLKMSLSGRTLQLNCLKDSVSQTIFEGQVIFSSETDIKSIGNLPLIVSDNKRKKLLYRKYDAFSKFTIKNQIKNSNKVIFPIKNSEFLSENGDFPEHNELLWKLLSKNYKDIYNKFYPVEIKRIYITCPFFNRLPRFNKTKKGESFSSKSCIEISEIKEVYYRHVEDITIIPQEVEVEQIEWMNFVVFDMVSLNDVGVQCDLISSNISNNKTFKLLMSIKCNQTNESSWNLEDVSIEPHEECPFSPSTYQLSQYLMSMDNHSKDSLITLKISDLDHLLSLKHKEIEQVIVNSNDSENYKSKSLTDLDKEKKTKDDKDDDEFHNNFDAFFFNTYYTVKKKTLKKKFGKSRKKPNENVLLNRFVGTRIEQGGMGDVGIQKSSVHLKENCSVFNFINEKVKTFFRLYKVKISESVLLLATDEDLVHVKEMDQKKFPVTFFVAYDHRNDYHRSLPVTGPDRRHRPPTPQYRRSQDPYNSPPQSRTRRKHEEANFAETEIQHRDSERVLAVFDLTGHEKNIFYDRTTPLVLNGGYSYESKIQSKSSTMKKVPSIFHPKAPNVSSSHKAAVKSLDDESLFVSQAERHYEKDIMKKWKAIQNKKKPTRYEQDIVEKTYMTHNFNSSQSLFDPVTFSAERQCSVISQNIGRRSTLLSLVKDAPSKRSHSNVLKIPLPSGVTRPETSLKIKNRHRDEDDCQSGEEIVVKPRNKKRVVTESRSEMNLNSQVTLHSEDTYRIEHSQFTFTPENKNSYLEMENSKRKYTQRKASPNKISSRRNSKDHPQSNSQEDFRNERMKEYEKYERYQKQMEDEYDQEDLQNERHERMKEYERYQKEIEDEYEQEIIATTQPVRTPSIVDLESELCFQKNMAKLAEQHHQQLIESDHDSDNDELREIELQNYNMQRQIPSWASMYQIRRDEEDEREAYLQRRHSVKDLIKDYFKDRPINHPPSNESATTVATRVEPSSSEESHVSDKDSIRSRPNFDKYEFTNKKKYEKLLLQKQREEDKTRNEQLLNRCYNRIRLNEVRRKLRMKRAAMQQMQRQQFLQQSQSPMSTNQSAKGNRQAPELRTSRSRMISMSANSSPQRSRIGNIEAEIRRRMRINNEAASRPRSGYANEFSTRERPHQVIESPRHR